METLSSTPIRVAFSGGWSSKRNRYKVQYGHITQYLLNEVVEVKTDKGKLVKLYASEYRLA